MTRTLHHVALEAGTAADIDAIEALMTQAFDPRFGEAWTRAQVIGGLALSGIWLTLARRDDRVVGFALARAILDEAELLLLAVAPDARRQRIGSALLRSVLADARGRRITRLHLEVRAGNSAIRLYETSGFTKQGERRAYYRGNAGRGYDAHTYGLGLESAG